MRPYLSLPLDHHHHALSQPACSLARPPPHHNPHMIVYRVGGLFKTHAHRIHIYTGTSKGPTHVNAHKEGHTRGGTYSMEGIIVEGHTHGRIFSRRDILTEGHSYGGTYSLGESSSQRDILTEGYIHGRTHLRRDIPLNGTIIIRTKIHAEGT